MAGQPNRGQVSLTLNEDYKDGAAASLDVTVPSPSQNLAGFEASVKVMGVLMEWTGKVDPSTGVGEFIAKADGRQDLKITTSLSGNKLSVEIDRRGKETWEGELEWKRSGSTVEVNGSAKLGSNA